MGGNASQRGQQGWAEAGLVGGEPQGGEVESPYARMAMLAHP